MMDSEAKTWRVSSETSWHQGESNPGRTWQYRTQSVDMVVRCSEWRRCYRLSGADDT
jgi:hypothetical protein